MKSRDKSIVTNRYTREICTEQVIYYISGEVDRQFVVGVITTSDEIEMLQCKKKVVILFLMTTWVAFNHSPTKIEYMHPMSPLSLKISKVNLSNPFFYVSFGTVLLDLHVLLLISYCRKP